MNMERDHKLSDHNLDIKNIVPCHEKLNKLIDEIFENQNEKGKETETKTENRTENVEETANTFKYQKYVENSKEVFRLSDPAMWLMYAILVSQKMSPEEIGEAKRDTHIDPDPNQENPNPDANETKVDFRNNKMVWAAIAIMSNFWNQVAGGDGLNVTTNKTSKTESNQISKETSTDGETETSPKYDELLKTSLKNYIYGMELRMHQYVSYFAGDSTYRVIKEILKHLIKESNDNVRKGILKVLNENENKNVSEVANVKGGKTSSGSILDVYSSIEPYLQLKEHDGGEAWSRLRAYFYKEGPPFVQNPSRLYVFGAAYIHHHHRQRNQRSPSSSFSSSK